MYRVFVVALILLGVMCACSHVDTETEMNGEPPKTSVTLTTNITTIPTTTKPGVPTTSLGIPLYTDVVGFDEYTAYVNSSELPNYFVKMEYLPPMGEFDCLSLKISAVNDGSYNEYKYRFELPSGFLYSLEIRHSDLEKGFSYETYEVISTQGDLREIADKGQGVKLYKQAGVSYMFINGTLSRAWWDYNHTRFIISGMRAGEKGYWDIAGAPAFIEDILHTDTVEVAMQTFAAAMAVK